MSLPKVRTHKNYQEFVKEQLAPGKIEIPIIFRDVFIKLLYLDLSPVSLILKERYSHQGPSARDPQDTLRSLLAMTLLGVTSIDEWVVLLRSFPSLAIISGFGTFRIPLGLEPSMISLIGFILWIKINPRLKVKGALEENQEV